MTRFELYSVEYDVDIESTVGVINPAAIKAMGEGNFRKELLQALVASIGIHSAHLFTEEEADQFMKQLLPLVKDAYQKERNLISSATTQTRK